MPTLQELSILGVISEMSETVVLLLGSKCQERFAWHIRFVSEDCIKSSKMQRNLKKTKQINKQTKKEMLSNRYFTLKNN